LATLEAIVITTRGTKAAGAVLTGILYFLAEATGHAAAIPPELLQLRADRAQMALDLSGPIAICVARHDTANPAFHGCVDWHSAVHGTWALTAYTWATGDSRYRSLVASILQPSLLVEEREHLAADLNFEMPYGRSWFLRLAIDYRRAFGTGALDAFGDEVAASLVAYYSHVAPNPTSSAYQSATWALVNLYDYGISRHDDGIVEFVKQKVRTYYLADRACPLKSAEIDTGEFMAVCTNWAWLVQKVLPRREFASWLDRFLPGNLPLDPITKPQSVHQTALNFSRSWGLWNLYWGTNDSRFLTLYLRHFNQTYSNAALWKGNYDTLSHWVAQFGMLDLILTYYDWP
jgi:hypothetical protein